MRPYSFMYETPEEAEEARLLEFLECLHVEYEGMELLFDDVREMMRQLGILIERQDNREAENEIS
jgi:hypothetical protein